MYRKGFTLIELLIVIIIVGILATLILPQIGDMTEKARLAEAKHMIGSLRTAIAVYALENDGMPAACADGAAINAMFGETIDLDRSLFNYSTALTSGNTVITVLRNSRKYTTGRMNKQIVATVDSSGNLTEDLDITDAAAVPPAPDA